MFIENNSLARRREKEAERQRKAQEKMDSQGLTDAQLLIVQLMEQNATLAAQNADLQAAVKELQEDEADG